MIVTLASRYIRVFQRNQQSPTTNLGQVESGNKDPGFNFLVSPKSNGQFIRAIDHQSVVSREVALRACTFAALQRPLVTIHCYLQHPGTRRIHRYTIKV